jgi:hypothetical protein
LIGEGLRSESCPSTLSGAGKGLRAIRALTALSPLACYRLAATGALLLSPAVLRTLHPALTAERTLPLTLTATLQVFLSKATSLRAESLAATGKGLRTKALTLAGRLALRPLPLFLNEITDKFPNALALLGGEVL